MCCFAQKAHITCVAILREQRRDCGEVKVVLHGTPGHFIWIKPKHLQVCWKAEASTIVSTFSELLDGLPATHPSPIYV